MEYVLRYDIEPTKSVEFRTWLQNNEGVMHEHSPDGWTYLGTWFTVRSFGEYTTETRWQLDDYGALGAGFGDAENMRVMQEWMGLIDQTRPFQAALYKSTDEVDILPGS